MQKRETPETLAILSANILCPAQLAVMVKAIAVKKKKIPCTCMHRKVTRLKRPVCGL